MNKDEQKQKLVSELETIEKDLNGLGRELNESGDWVATVDDSKDEHIDPGDDANITEELEGEIAVLNVLEQRHEQVLKALSALENGAYGICEVCGEKISDARLEANPSATTCVEHAS